MKKHYQKYCRHLTYVIISTSTFLFTTKTFSQEKLTITPELSKQIIDKYQVQTFKIYPVVIKEIDYKTYDTTQVLTAEYKRELKKLDQYKPAFDLYNNTLKENEEKKEAIKTILQNIDTFLASDEKHDIKEKLLIDSQTLADRYNIKVIAIDERMKLNDFIKTSNNNQQTSTKNILIYEKGKRSSKNDLKTFQTEIQKIKIKEPEKTNDYRWYLESQKELSTIQKTETGKVLSDKISKKSVYVSGETPVELNVLSGDFIKLPDYYILINNEVEYKFVKNELITEKDDDYSTLRGDFDRFPIIKNSMTNELFYVTSNRFIGQLEIEINRANFQNIGNTAEYKTWRTNYLTLLQSAQTNVNACNVIIKKHTYLNRLGQKRYDSTTFTKQEKTSFNQNLDSLNEKLKKIGDLEDKRDFLAYYNDKASNEEATKSYTLSSFYSSTSRSY
ncbi:hypothetical protein [Flavobacterium sp. FlaQc-28]|uniref:hypothetical protein n=1 Tax=Flavobacterium sp. FlaQc-28 TaxID=3374178 RepID=UPI0037572B9C